MALRCTSLFLLVSLQQASCESLNLLQTSATVVQVDTNGDTKPLKSAKARKHDADLDVVRESQPTGRPSKNESAAEATGVAQNEAGDLNAFVAALITNIITIIIFFVSFGSLRKKYPIVYSKEAMTLKTCPEVADDGYDDAPEDVKAIVICDWQDKVPFVPDDTTWGWWTASYKVTISEIVEYRGLDQGMMIEFTNLAMRILCVTGVPLVFIMGPCHCWLGGYRAGPPGDPDADYLSYWGMANVVDGHPWLYWAHAVMLWFVVIVVQRMCYTSMRDFMERRNEWLKGLPPPRSTTILVEGIPEEYRHDEKLKSYFNRIFGAQVVESTMVMKDTSQLMSYVHDQEKVNTKVEELKFEVHKDPSKAAELKEEEAKLVECKKATNIKRLKVLEAAKSPQEGEIDPNLGTAFVTFKNRRDAELAKMMQYRANAEDFVISIPPAPADTIYTDLCKDPVAQQVRDIIGYGLLAGVFYVYLPTVICIAYYTSLETLAEIFPSMQSMSDDPSTSALWDGLVNALALQLFVAFVPTFFCMIFCNFFVLKADAWLQQRIQSWYFYFLVIFVLLVTAVGSSLVDTMETLAENPLYLFRLLADTLPLSTHFYLNYLPLQWVTHAQNLLRTSNLGKYLMFKKLFGAPIAIKKSEPEDQDYYGLGSRSARFTFLLVLVNCFGSLSPLVTILGLINFWMCRKVYGYLVVFCEKRKPDLGGPFFVTSLEHIMQGQFIYIILMSGVLMERNADIYPGAIAASAIIFQYISYGRFKKIFRWESLTFEELEELIAVPSMAAKMCKSKPAPSRAASGGKYIQPELA